jgi:hypothetical protein
MVKFDCGKSQKKIDVDGIGMRDRDLTVKVRGREGEVMFGPMPFFKLG